MRKKFFEAGKSTRGPRFVVVLVSVFAEWLQLLLPMSRCVFACIEAVLLLWPATAVAVLLCPILSDVAVVGITMLLLLMLLLLLLLFLLFYCFYCACG
jgi:hypothetical protein